MMVIEAAHNAQKHAFSQHVGSCFHVSLRRSRGGQALLTVRDDGPGYMSNDLAPSDRSLGLSVVRGLVNQLHGDLMIKSDGGVQIRVAFPISN
jgi:two-component sensor histidine kinase